jgi:hypothetical protein
MTQVIVNPIVDARIDVRRFKKSNARSKYYGVIWCKKEGLWLSRFIYNDRTGKKHHKHLGKFKDERDAALAYDKVAIHFNQPTNILKRHEPNKESNGKSNQHD